jgi:hypothetical protein
VFASLNKLNKLQCLGFGVSDQESDRREIAFFSQVFDAVYAYDGPPHLQDGSLRQSVSQSIYFSSYQSLDHAERKRLTSKMSLANLLPCFLARNWDSTQSSS